ncbi:hypothetical protein SDC9_142032 [bioreactor metagenome]|uniref:GGDEF domain-containing protein n=1 Tax=bioreactor metagenome TaxID=1076179 RepID=A0A645E228_9ZZZZ
MKKQKPGKSSLKLDFISTVVIVMYFALVVVFSYSGIKNSSENIILLMIVMLGMVFGYYTNLVASLVFSVIAVFIYSSYNIFLNIARSIPISAEVYFWVIVIPLFTIVSGYRGQLTKSLQDENAKIKRENEELVSIDKETGLKNSQLFFDELQSYMNISKRYGIQVYLMLIDIRYKTEIIRTFGRAKYNEIIKELSAVIEEFLRYEDKKFFMRATDKFGIVFLSNPEGGNLVKKRFQKIFEDYQFKNGGILNQIRFQVAVGLAEYDPASSSSPYDFLKQAEKDMEYDV